MIPDIVGYTLEEALEILQREGKTVDSIAVTAAPRVKLKQIDNSFRVVRIDLTVDEKVRLLVVHSQITL